MLQKILFWFSFEKMNKNKTEFNFIGWIAANNVEREMEWKKINKNKSMRWESIIYECRKKFNLQCISSSCYTFNGNGKFFILFFIFVSWKETTKNNNK